MAIHRDVDPGSKLSFLEWYPQTILPELAKLPNEEVSYQHLLRSLEYWDDIAIGKAETAILLHFLSLSTYLILIFRLKGMILTTIAPH